MAAAPPDLGALPPDAAADADPEHLLFGQIVVFTGALSIRRQEAWDAVASCGAVVETGVNKRTTMLVVGDGFTGHDPAEFWTGKAAKATKWRAKGHQIEVLTEADLVDLLPKPHLRSPESVRLTGDSAGPRPQSNCGAPVGRPT